MAIAAHCHAVGFDILVADNQLHRNLGGLRLTDAVAELFIAVVNADSDTLCLKQIGDLFSIFGMSSRSDRNHDRLARCEP